jgi:hypothetical protein
MPLARKSLLPRRGGTDISYLYSIFQYRAGVVNTCVRIIYKLVFTYIVECHSIKTYLINLN